MAAADRYNELAAQLAPVIWEINQRRIGLWSKRYIHPVGMKHWVNSAEFELGIFKNLPILFTGRDPEPENIEFNTVNHYLLTQNVHYGVVTLGPNPIESETQP